MKRSILFVGAVLFSGFSGVMMVQAEPRMPADRCELPAIMPICPAGQAPKPLLSDRGVCRYLCEQVAQPTASEEQADPPTIDLLNDRTDVVLRCPFMITARKEELKNNIWDGYYCVCNRNDKLVRANLLGYVKPGKSTVLSATVKKRDEIGAMTEEKVVVVMGEPFSAGDDYKAVIHYSEPVELVAGTPSRHRHHRRHRAK